MKSKNFCFGKNWLRFLKDPIPEKRLEVAVRSIKDFMGVDDLKDKLFLDVGCGSGFFSAAALKLGAQVLAFNPDKDCLECAKTLLFEHFKFPKDKVNVLQGSILDKEFVNSLPKADIVYSYGVLHHTGNMWLALENVKGLAKPGGCLCIAIYNTMGGFFNGSKAWARKKQIYNRLPGPIQFGCQLAYILRTSILPNLIRGRNFVKLWKDYYQKRGESYWLDVHDWLGGYPYEYARPDEIFDFYKQKYELVNLLTRNTLALNAFLFKRKDDQTDN